MSLQHGEYKISLDRKDRSANINFISHAHSDHTSAANTKSKFISSKATANLIKARKSISIDYSESIPGIRLLNAGHILGSKQLRVENEHAGFTVTYSGDYQVERSCVAEPIEIKETDYLIIDSTYPDPEVKFEEKSEIIYTIQRYVRDKLDKGIILFQTYSLGKAQELVKILNEIGVTPITNKGISALNDVYIDHGVKLEYVSDHDKESEELKQMHNGNFVQICDHFSFSEYRERILGVHGRRVFTAIATGFAQTMKFNTDVQFGLSDHADFSQALDYIDASNPKLVYTFGPNSKVFAHHLVKQGYRAKPYADAIEQLIPNAQSTE